MTWRWCCGLAAKPLAPEPQLRYAMACSLFTGLCSTGDGQAVGLPPAQDERHRVQAALFARHRLIPIQLLPGGWHRMAPEELADIFLVPPSVATARRQELKDE